MNINIIHGDCMTDKVYELALKDMIVDINNICRTSSTNTDKIKHILHLCDIYEDKLKK